ncbi:MAG TPA: hypothetical protein VFF28_01635 [Candidatus Nanoarchaeia archaeon]|nr:hypothetical protein [Candidatus Nanoarchaeia archaeon]
MKSEFPPDEQLSPHQLETRVKTSLEHDGNAQHIVKVIRGDKPEKEVDNRGFMIYHIYKPQSGSPFALIEYTASVGDNKSLGYGTQLFNQVKKELARQGVEHLVIETEMVPRVVENPVHTDLEDFTQTYGRTGDLWTISKGIGVWNGIDRRNHFWQERGFGIVPDLAYCQPDLAEGKMERRVPLDAQVASLKGDGSEISAPRIRQILLAIAEHNYDLGRFSTAFVDKQLQVTYSGKPITDNTIFEVIPYNKLLAKPEVSFALRMNSLKTRYQ